MALDNQSKQKKILIFTILFIFVFVLMAVLNITKIYPQSYIEDLFSKEQTGKLSEQLIYNGNPLHDHTVYDSISNVCSGTNLGFTTTILPCYAQGNNWAGVTQYVNFTWKGATAKNISFIFIYDGKIDYGNMYVWQNVTKVENGFNVTNMWVNNYLVSGVNNYTNLGNPDYRCSLGNVHNTQMYQVNQNNNLITIYCFTNISTVNSSAFMISGNADNLTYFSLLTTKSDYFDITNLVQYLGYGLLGDNKSYYQAENARFLPNQTYQTKWVYFPKSINPNGKWSILAYEKETGLINSITSNQYMLVDPWYGLASSSLDSGLVAYYNGSTPNDVTGLNNGSFVGQAYVQQGGKFGYTYQFNITSDYMTVPTNAKAGLLPIRPFSVSMWVNNTAWKTTGSGTALIGNANGGTGGYGFRFPTSASQMDVVWYNIEANSKYVNPVFANQTWYQVAFVANSSGIYYYRNGVRVNFSTSTANASNSVNNLQIGKINIADSDSPVGQIDEIGIWNRSLSDAEISNLYNGGTGTYYQLNNFSAITFLNQSPSDVTSINVIGNPLNISYYISTPSVNLSRVLLGFKVNRSDIDGSYYINGSIANLGFANYSYTYNSSSNFYWIFDDNDVYPATYNFNEDAMELTSKSFFTEGATFLASVELLNISSIKNYSFFELNVKNNSASAGVMTVYYCNSTYNTGTVSSNNNCYAFGSILPSQIVNHTHTGAGNSSHYVLTLPINTTTGKVGTVVMTNRSFFIYGANAWNVAYITNVTRANASRTTNNNGNAWSALGGTFDAHLHQFNGLDSIYYYASSYDNLAVNLTSDIRSDQLQLISLPPSSPVVISPINAIYGKSVNITYNPSISLLGSILYYNISLQDANLTYNQSIRANNSLNLTYIWNTTNIQTGFYYIKVWAYDSNGLSSYGLSQLFLIDNIYPNVTLLNPLSFGNVTDLNGNYSAKVKDNFELLNATLEVYNMSNLALVSSHAITGLSGQENNVEASASLSDGIYYWRYSVCDTVGNCNYSENRTVNVTLPDTYFDYIVYLLQYPYVDVNQSYPLSVKLLSNSTYLTATSVFLNLDSSVGGHQVISLVLNSSTSSFDVVLNFTQEGDFMFNINQSNWKFIGQDFNGTFKVRKPYYLTVQGFKDNNNTKYTNSFAYVTVQPLSFTPDSIYSSYVQPIAYKYTATSSVFHGKYVNGESTIKLWEKNQTYALRLIDGQISFADYYSPIIITKSYGINTFLGGLYLNGTDQTYQFLLTDKDLHPYRWLVNILTILAVILVVIGCLALVFVMPQYPIVSVTIMIISLIAIAVVRVVIWLYLGW
jgi:hypothetical protein